MKKKDIAMLVSGTIAGMSLVCTGAAGFVLKEKFFRQKTVSEKPGQIESIDEMHMDYMRRKGLARIRAQRIESIEITSRDGLRLAGEYVHNTETKRAPGEGTPVVLLSHGYGGSNRDLMIFADFYIREGFDMLIIDQRTHGSSEGSFITMGAKESDDIIKWVSRIIEIAGTDCRILLHGWSMGAASIYLAAARGLAPQVKGLIYDCGFADIDSQLFHTAMGYAYVPKVVLWYVLQFMKPLARLICGFSFGDSSPLAVAGQMQLPIFFVHGRSDSVVPARFGTALFHATSHTPYRQQLLVPEADHTYAYAHDRAGYEAGIRELIEYCM